MLYKNAFFPVREKEVLFMGERLLSIDPTIKYKKYRKNI